MPRPHRVFDPELPYHVTTRGNDGRRLFREPGDQAVLLALLARMVARYDLTCASYCLMTNHYHLLFTGGVERLPPAMHVLNSGCAHRFNRRYGHEHHVFGRRYASIAIETEEHLLAAHRYIALNPVAGGLCEHPADWPWSSYGATAGCAAAPRFLDVDGALRPFGADRITATARFRTFVEAGVVEAA